MALNTIPHIKVRSEAVHVDVSILFQLSSKLGSQGTVKGRRKIAQSILQCLLFGQLDM